VAGAEFQGFGLLVASDGAGLVEAGLGLGRVRDRLLQQEVSLNLTQLRCAETFFPLCNDLQSLSEQAQSRFGRSGFPIRFGQSGTEIGLICRRTGCPPALQPLVHLR
jgi:hypothetical protein